MPCSLRRSFIPLDHAADVLKYPCIKTIKFPERIGISSQKTAGSRKIRIFPRFSRRAGLKFQATLAAYLGVIFFLGYFLFAANRVVEPVNASLPRQGQQKFMVRGSVHKGAVRMAVTGYTVRVLVDRSASHPLYKESSVKAPDKPSLAAAPANPENEQQAVKVAKAVPSAPRTLPRRRPLGKLSALFESGLKGVRAIGYDIKGGTSYGKYQLSSRKGTMDMFIQFLEENAPNWAERLKNSGPSNTRSLRGAMPREWRRIAAEDPKGFEALQDEFIHTMYYSPALEEVFFETGFDFKTRPAVFREVLWSATVHHGPRGGAGIFIKAARKARGRPALQYHKALLEEIFRERKIRVARASTRRRLALENRLKRERALAMAMLEELPDTLLLTSM
ncbi:MAG: hypothetical protein SVS15_08265 [Thermodesulfobacteriota bacterium]|nr:hypothetical protein [Thermodesulfobacteriota bacterium]